MLSVSTKSCTYFQNLYTFKKNYTYIYGMYIYFFIFPSLFPCRFLRNPSELKSIKNISLLRQQMEAQAAAQKLAAQQVAQAALRGLQHEAVGAASVKSEEEPTDLTMDAEEKALRLRERLDRERLNRPLVAASDSVDIRDREQHEPRHPQFDFRHLIPQVSIKSE